MSRKIAFAIVVAAASTAAVAAPQRQLVAPELNPALRTVPWIPQAYKVRREDASCEARLIAHIDAGTVIPGPDGRVAHVTGVADGAIGEAELVITSIAADGLSATADFLACMSSTGATPAPVNAAAQLSDARLQSIAVRTQTNTLVLRAQ